MTDVALADGWTFVVQTSDADDDLLRVLNRFVVAGARLAAVSMERRLSSQLICIEARNLDERRAESLRNWLQALPATQTVTTVRQLQDREQKAA